MKYPIHFQKELQRPICYKGRSESVTFKESAVTCGNCLSLLKLSARQKAFGKTDWNAIYVTLGDKTLPQVKKELRRWLFAHPQYKAECDISNYPPKINMLFYIPASGDKRRKSVGMDDGKDPLHGSMTQIFIPREAELDTVATFVGSVADTHSLRPQRTERDSEAALHYELRPAYDDQKARLVS